MAKLHFLWLAWGPVLFCFSLAWLASHPDDWTGPAIVGPLSALYGVVSYRYAFRRLKRSSDSQLALLAAMIAAPLVGIGVGLMIVFGGVR
jgi:hypothetical protein